MSTIDHKAEAESIAEVFDSEVEPNTGNELRLAQVHATLYLAEQQRIANLIAWWETNGRLTPEAQSEIVKGLGL